MRWKYCHNCGHTPIKKLGGPGFNNYDGVYYDCIYCDSQWTKDWLIEHVGEKTNWEA